MRMKEKGCLKLEFLLVTKCHFDSWIRKEILLISSCYPNLLQGFKMNRN